MQFIYDNGKYKVARITGPQHNLLAISLAERNCNIEVVSLAMKVGERVNVLQEDVLKQVKLGLGMVNEELGKEYYISEVQYLPSDSKTSNIYSFLIKELIKRIDEQGEFIKV